MCVFYNMSLDLYDIESSINEITLYEIEEWIKYLYEHLGWMTIAYSNDNNEKIISYIKSIKKLNNTIQERLKIVTNEDVRIDLETNLRKMAHLQKITLKLFNKESLKETQNTYILMGGKDDSKKNSKKSSRKNSKKSPKKSSKKTLKKSSKKTSSKEDVKKSSKNKINELLIKKLSKKNSKTKNN